MDVKQNNEMGLVIRRPGLEPASQEKYWKSLDIVTFSPVEEFVREIGENRELLFEATAPIRDIIAKNEGALGSLKKVSDFRQQMVKRASDHILTKPGSFSPFTSFALTPGVHAFSPPYDLARQGPNKGSPTVSTSDRNKGEIFVCVPFDNESHGSRIAAGSLVIIFASTVLGTISVRPLVQYAYNWDVAGLHLSAHSEGRLTITAIRDRDGRVEDTRSVLMWSRTTESDHHFDSSDGTVYPPEFHVEFLADPAEIYLVSITAIVSGDQSGKQPILAFPSWSFFAGSISASVPYLAAELRQ